MHNPPATEGAPEVDEAMRARWISV